MDGSRPVKLFRNGRNQAVRIPREFEMPGQDAVMRQDGERLIIEPAGKPQGLVALLDRWAREEPLGEHERLEPIPRPLPRPFEL